MLHSFPAPSMTRWEVCVSENGFLVIQILNGYSITLLDHRLDINVRFHKRTLNCRALWSCSLNHWKPTVSYWYIDLFSDLFLTPIEFTIDSHPINIFVVYKQTLTAEAIITNIAARLPFSFNFLVIKPPVAVPKPNPNTPNIAMYLWTRYCGIPKWFSKYLGKNTM